MVAPPPPTLAVRRAGAPPPFGRGAAWNVPTANGDIALYVTSEIVKNTDVQKMPEDPGEAPWKKAKLELLTKHGSSQNDPSREIQ